MEYLIFPWFHFYKFRCQSGAFNCARNKYFLNFLGHLIKIYFINRFAAGQSNSILSGIPLTRDRMCDMYGERSSVL